MPARPLSRQLLLLSAGLVVGSGSAWTLRQLRSPAAASPASRAAPPSASDSLLPAPSSLLVLPPLLAGAEADAALDAYLALPPLPAKASPVEIAKRSARLRALLTLLPTSSFDRLFAALALRTGAAEAALRRIAFDVWTERDAPAAARWASSLVPGEAIDASARSRYATQAALAWARSGFDAAYAWASALPDAKLGRSISLDLISRLAATDPARALVLAQGGDEKFASEARQNVFKVWAEKDPAAALQSLGTALVAENDQGRWRIADALAKWAVADPRAALAWLDSSSGLERDDLNSALWSIVGRVSHGDKIPDLRPFADALIPRAQAGGQQYQLAELLRSWCDRDSSSALAWLDAIPDAAFRDDLLNATLNHGSSRSEQNLPLALRLPPGPLRDTALSKALADWADRDADAALAWLREHDDPALATAAARLQGALLGKLAADDPAGALARWQSLPADETRTAAAPGIAKAWAASDPAAASAWLFAQLPALPDMTPADFEKMSPQAQAELQQKFMAYEGHFETLTNSVSAWFRKDPAGLVAWADKLPSKLMKEELLSNLGRNLGNFDDEIPDPAVRAAEIAAIPDASLRERILANHLGAWLGADVHAARDWIDSHEAISPAKAAELLQRATPAP